MFSFPRVSVGSAPAVKRAAGTCAAGGVNLLLRIQSLMRFSADHRECGLVLGQHTGPHPGGQRHLHYTPTAPFAGEARREPLNDVSFLSAVTWARWAHL